MENKMSTSNIYPIVLPEGEKKWVGKIIKKLFDKIIVQCFPQRINNINPHTQNVKSQVAYIKIEPNLYIF